MCSAGSPFAPTGVAEPDVVVPVDPPLLPVSAVPATALPDAATPAAAA